MCRTPRSAGTTCGRAETITAVLFTVGKTAIGYYIGQASVGSAYSAAGSMVVLLVWVDYSALIVFFGAEFTQAWATRQGAVAPKPKAVSGCGAPDLERGRPTSAPRGREPCHNVYGWLSRLLIRLQEPENIDRDP